MHNSCDTLLLRLKSSTSKERPSNFSSHYCLCAPLSDILFCPLHPPRSLSGLSEKCISRTRLEESKETAATLYLADKGGGGSSETFGRHMMLVTLSSNGKPPFLRDLFAENGPSMDKAR